MNCQGFDVSDNNGEIQWSAAAQGKQFSLVKASEGVNFTDKQLFKNLPGSQDAKLLTGVYHMFVPADDMMDQVHNFLNSFKEAGQPDFLVADFEGYFKNGADEWATLSAVDTFTTCTNFLKLIKLGSKITPIAYYGKSFSAKLLGWDLTAWPVWWAQYSPTPTIPAGIPPWSFWQYSENGSLAGVNGPVDLDYFNGDLATLESFVQSLKS